MLFGAQVAFLWSSFGSLMVRLRLLVVIMNLPLPRPTAAKPETGLGRSKFSSICLEWWNNNGGFKVFENGKTHLRVEPRVWKA